MFTRLTALWILLVPVFTVVRAQAPGPSSGAAVPGLVYELSEVAPGVYAATARGVPYYVSNSVVVVGDDEVLLVDTGAGASEARALHAAIRTITALPVRYVVDTHCHFDHALGHAAFPEAVTIGHVATRAGLALGVGQPTLANNLEGMPARAGDLRARAREEPDAAKRASLLDDAAKWDDYRRRTASLEPSPSRLTFTDQITVWLGRREVRILHLGRGHTAGDAVVYLPAERVVCTGDLFNGYIGYMGDAFVDDWADTLERLAQLEFRIVVAGHGKPFEGKDAIRPVQDCLRDIWRQATALKNAGVPAREAAARLDLRAHAPRFPQFSKPGFDRQAVERVFQVIEERKSTR